MLFTTLFQKLPDENCEENGLN